MTLATRTPRTTARHALRRISPRALLRRELDRADAQVAELSTRVGELTVELTAARTDLNVAAAGAAQAAETCTSYAKALEAMAHRVADLEAGTRELGQLRLANQVLTARLAEARKVGDLGATPHPSDAEIAAGERTRTDTVELPTLADPSRPAGPVAEPRPAAEPGRRATPGPAAVSTDGARPFAGPVRTLHDALNTTAV